MWPRAMQLPVGIQLYPAMTLVRIPARTSYNTLNIECNLKC